jgi:plastocyanin
MIRRAALAAATLLIMSTASVSAATTTVSVVNYTYNPKTPKIALSGSILWRNDSNTAHTVTANVPAVWPGSFGVLTAGKTGSLAFFHVGAYPYFCTFHSQQKGSVKVKMSVSPASGTTSTNFTIRVATQNAASGFTHDVQRRKKGGSFATWMSSPSQLVVFNPTTSERGTWEFRARYRKTSTGEKTGWSPIVTVKVN